VELPRSSGQHRIVPADSTHEGSPTVTVPPALPQLWMSSRRCSASRVVHVRSRSKCLAQLGAVRCTCRAIAQTKPTNSRAIAAAGKRSCWKAKPNIAGSYAGRVFTGLDWYIRDRLWRWMRKKRPRAGARDILGAFLPSTRRADSTALARWPGRAAHARLDPGLPVPSCMDEDAGLRLVFWRAGCVTKGACPVRKEATGNRPLRSGAALVAYFTRRVLLPAALCVLGAAR
jgi:Group II intron, maturase-specific domain